MIANIPDPLNILTYTHTHLVEEIMALGGRDGGREMRQRLERLSVEELTRLRGRLFEDATDRTERTDIAA